MAKIQTASKKTASKAAPVKKAPVKKAPIKKTPKGCSHVVIMGTFKNAQQADKMVEILSETMGSGFNFATALLDADASAALAAPTDCKSASKCCGNKTCTKK